MVHSREDQLLADLVSERLRRFTIVDRSRFFTDTVTQILDEQGYGRNHPDWRQHKSAICSILGSRGGRKKPKTSRKAVLAGKAGELFATGAMVSLAPVVTPLPVLPKYRPPTTPLWPAITDDM
ncbi:MAG: hypothetical protein NTU97_00710, partial [Candidatus Magasanikbacteria bacterium]|nr:hypothetical protein [Candidatus Magasanikbacteria bacterium]